MPLMSRRTHAQDLSLLTHLSRDDIAHLQTVGKEAQAVRLKFILKDDQDEVISYLESLKDRDARVDFVLDNGMYACHLARAHPNSHRISVSRI